MAVWDDIKKQHKKVRKKGFKAMMAYFWDYYKIHTVVVVFVGLFTFFLIRDMLSNLPYGFYAMMINSTLHPDSDVIGEDFANYAGIDTTSYDVLIDTNVTLSTGEYNSYDVSTQERIMAITAAGDLDVIVTDQSVFEQYARNDYMTDLRTLMSEEELSKYEGYIYYVDKAIIDAIMDGSYESSSDASLEESAADDLDDATSDATVSDQEISYMLGISSPSSIVTADNFVLPDPSTMEDPMPVGIVLTDTAFMQETQTFAGTVPVFGIIGNSSHTQEALKFLEYMYTYTATE
ncbi:hypothetical protein SAMN02745229_03846 [Butyrivibrio fibrisolvens DSM 3071]|uniref:Extracellular solute-binding protein n=1 Tax=Butyrivibrio fibrisolvens DSM 3071 TaxID=1121131 RepID=A0A1M6F481_BUTFI|nr:hypothetical protein [Butyrivibrio fibrisolvens]SHI92409.1 hypothetical protein SAMN02745229_03846 [Butyrivibrio fibrisolvens DSM 3071]